MFKRTSIGMAACLALSCAPAANAHIVDNVVEHSADNAAVKLSPIGSYEAGVIGKSAAEIVAYHAASQRILTVNAQSGKVDILDASDPTNPNKVAEVSAGGDKEINSVAVRPDGLAVAAVQQADKTENGEALIFDVTSAEELGRAPLGALPDNVHITKDGAYALTANEGEPSDELNSDGTEYAKDPEGTVSVISLPDGVQAPSAADVRTADFRAFDGADAELDPSIRVFGPENHHNKPSLDFEPEYISSADGKAYVTLQENNAIAVVDIASATVDKVLPAHIADHSDVPIDPSNKDGAAKLRTIPVHGLSMPDSIGAFQTNGETYFATANEGDAREWGGYTDEVKLKDLVEEGQICDSVDLPEGIEDKKYAGNLKLSNASGWNEEKGCFDGLYSYGSRSFSIYDAEGNVVFDSGSDFEEITKDIEGLNFNADNEDPDFDDRSNNKGPEPEALTIGTVSDRTYAFIGMERVGGIFVYDVTDPAHAEFVTYSNNRDFAVDYNEDNAVATRLAGDLGPEGLAFVSKEDSPTDDALLIAGNEVSGTTTVFSVADLVGGSEDEGENASDEDGDAPDDVPGAWLPGDGSSSIAKGVGIIAGVIALGAMLSGVLHFMPQVADQFYKMLPEPVRQLLP
ncbi:choice-of-anchor I family protein [Corynebacterium rhinophilum]|uniref:choice-of-anchor I family protein n=1 Tax=Corynebacterium rhinophilum TaxID=3050197 RepID=UPI00255016FD|nr:MULTISPECIES: choice-of-anchor I family protein [unclassified Corynebacterium]MDK8671667.1 choice-of-anchor I family protein [Corynebacterium sp. MSK189]MDK8735022.1 choice-of-anchor I family protein [Corynebacterium sp. MSK306]